MIRLTIEIVAAALAAVLHQRRPVRRSPPAAGRAARRRPELARSSVPQNASPAARCAAIRRQCGGKFHAQLLRATGLLSVNVSLRALPASHRKPVTNNGALELRRQARVVYLY